MPTLQRRSHIKCSYIVNIKSIVEKTTILICSIPSKLMLSIMSSGKPPQKILWVNCHQAHSFLYCLCTFINISVPCVVVIFIGTVCKNKCNKKFWDADVIAMAKSTMFALHKTVVEVVLLMTLTAGNPGE